MQSQIKGSVESTSTQDDRIPFYQYSLMESTPYDLYEEEVKDSAFYDNSMFSENSNTIEESKSSSHAGTCKKEEINVSLIDGRYQIVKRFGKSTEPYKQVYLVQDIKSHSLVVLKFFNTNEASYFQDEVEANLRVNPSSTRQVLMERFVDYSQQKQPVNLCGIDFHIYAYMTMPYCKYGSVIDLLIKANDQNRQISLELQKYLFRGLLLAINELYQLSGLSHCDIKPDNVVIDENFQVKLIDYGHALPKNTFTDKVTGTDQYMAPEIIQTQKCPQQGLQYHTDQVDVFNIGVYLFILMFQKPPFIDRADPKDPFYRLVCEQRFSDFFVRHGASAEQRIPLDGLNVIWSSLDCQAHKRPSITDLMITPFVRLGPNENMMICDDLKDEIVSFFL
eukprot:403364033